MRTMHWDETTPHPHAGVTCFYDERKKEIQMLFQRSSSRNGLSDLCKHFDDHMEKGFQFMTWVSMIRREVESQCNENPIKELSRKLTAKSRNRRIEKTKYLSRKASSSPEDAGMWKEIADKESQQALQ